MQQGGTVSARRLLIGYGLFRMWRERRGAETARAGEADHVNWAGKVLGEASEIRNELNGAAARRRKRQVA